MHVNKVPEIRRYITLFVLISVIYNIISGQSAGLSSTPVFNRNHGFYYAPFTLEIGSEDNTARIYYTTDGSQPGVERGKLYSGPIEIKSTSIIRAVCIKDNQVTGKIATSTFLFPDEVTHQSNIPVGYPSAWGPYTGISGTAIADYEMDPGMMTDPVFENSVKEALLDLPTISIVTNKGYLFSNSQNPDTGGIYIYTGPPLTNTTNGLGFSWERPVSFEYFDAKDSVSFQIDCGIQIQGGHGRRPEKSPKHSFRLVFKSIYGPSKLDFPLFGNGAASSFNTIVLRAGFGNTWIHWSPGERSMAQYLRDRWTKDTHSAMGHRSSQGIYVHLYINGLYWGIYNPSERLDSDFAVSYLGGTEEDFDVIKDYAEVVDGNITAWNKAITMANAGLSSNDAYHRLRGNNPDGTPNSMIEAMVDVVSLTDYMILNFYGGNWDWDHHNWVAIRNRVEPGTGFKFFCWDAEHMVEGINANILSENNNNCPSRLFQQLRQNFEFRRLFADRVQKFCFNNGGLTPESAAERWKMRANTIDKAVIAESARWGDYRRDVHPWQTGTFDLYTRADHWLPQQRYLLESFFPARTAVFIGQLRSANLFPKIDAPVFLINNSPVIESNILPGDILTISSNEGVVYYTTDGSDPVLWNSSPVVSLAALRYSSPIVLIRSGHIKARKFLNGEWSAINEYVFMVPADYQNTESTEELITIYQNYPNPFSETTSFPFQLHKNAKVEMTVYNMSGKLIFRIQNTENPIGFYMMNWNGHDQNNNLITNGIYNCRFTVTNQSEKIIRTKKVILMR